MMCQTCGSKMVKTGCKDSRGNELWIGDIVWISWTEKHSAIARIVLCLDHKNQALSPVDPDAPTHPVIEIEPGTIRIGGEIADHVHQGMYQMEKSIKNSNMCIFLYRPVSVKTEGIESCPSERSN